MTFVLENLPGIQDVLCSEHQPCDNIAITSWEQRYSTVLPHEIKDFYLATDGFRLTWSFSHAGIVIGFLPTCYVRLLILIVEYSQLNIKISFL